VHPVTVVKLEGDHLTLRISAGARRTRNHLELTASGGKSADGEAWRSAFARSLAFARRN